MLSFKSFYYMACEEADLNSELYAYSTLMKLKYYSCDRMYRNLSNPIAASGYHQRGYELIASLKKFKKRLTLMLKC